MSPAQIRVGAAVLAVLAIVAAIAWIYRSGSDAGAAKVEVKAERERGERVAEARTDERSAGVVVGRIARKTERADALTDKYLAKTIEDLRDALDAVPPSPGPGDPAAETAGGAGAPPAPVERLRDAINAGVDRANRAADAADAAE